MQKFWVGWRLWCSRRGKVQNLHKTYLTRTQCLGTIPPSPCPQLNSSSFVEKVQKKYFFFSLQQDLWANCVIYKAICSEHSHQCSRDKFELFLLQKYPISFRFYLWQLFAVDMFDSVAFIIFSCNKYESFFAAVIWISLWQIMWPTSLLGNGADFLIFQGWKWKLMMKAFEKIRESESHSVWDDITLLNKLNKS